MKKREEMFEELIGLSVQLCKLATEVQGVALVIVHEQEGREGVDASMGGNASARLHVARAQKQWEWVSKKAGKTLWRVQAQLEG